MIEPIMGEIGMGEIGMEEAKCSVCGKPITPVDTNLIGTDNQHYCSIEHLISAIPNSPTPL